MEYHHLPTEIWALIALELQRDLSTRIQRLSINRFARTCKTFERVCIYDQRLLVDSVFWDPYRICTNCKSNEHEHPAFILRLCLKPPHPKLLRLQQERYGRLSSGWTRASSSKWFCHHCRKNITDDISNGLDRFFPHRNNGASADYPMMRLGDIRVFQRNLREHVHFVRGPIPFDMDAFYEGAHSIHTTNLFFTVSDILYGSNHAHDRVRIEIAYAQKYRTAFDVVDGNEGAYVYWYLSDTLKLGRSDRVSAKYYLGSRRVPLTVPWCVLEAIVADRSDSLLHAWARAIHYMLTKLFKMDDLPISSWWIPSVQMRLTISALLMERKEGIITPSHRSAPMEVSARINLHEAVESSMQHDVLIRVYGPSPRPRAVVWTIDNVTFDMRRFICDDPFLFQP